MLHGTLVSVSGNFITVNINGDEQTFILSSDTRFLKGSRFGEQKEIALSQIKIGDTIALHGPPISPIHAVRVEEKVTKANGPSLWGKAEEGKEEVGRGVKK